MTKAGRPATTFGYDALFMMTYGYDSEDRLKYRTGDGISDYYDYATVENKRISVARNGVEVDSVFSTAAVGGSTANLDSTVTRVNGVRYRILHSQPGTLSTPATMTVTASSGVSFRTRRVYADGTTGLVNSVQDGFNTAYPGYNGEALPNSLYNPSCGTHSASYTTLHAPSETSFSDPTLGNTFGRGNHYDALGRVDLLNSPGAGIQHAYYYDQYGELTDDRISAGCYGSVITPDEGANYANCTYGAGWTRYSYDAVGNRTDLGATYFAGNRLANFNGGFLTYDADGNVSQKYGIGSNPHNQFFYWNPESRLDSVSYDGYYTVKYEYNALGQPVKKYRQGALDRVWLWDGDQLLAEFDASNARVADYQYSGTDQPYAQTYGAYAPGGVRYHEQDALGNVIGTHEGTSVTQTITYDAWGTPSVSGNEDSRLMWKGLLWEGDVVGLYYMRGRWYDPELGRFIQEDPIGLAGGINVYAFAHNDPVNGSDPSGLADPADAPAFCAGLGFGYVDFNNGQAACIVGGGGIAKLPLVAVWGAQTKPGPFAWVNSPPTLGGWLSGAENGVQGPRRPPGTRPLTPSQRGQVREAIQNLNRRPACRKLAAAAGGFFPSGFYFNPQQSGGNGFKEGGHYDSNYQGIVLMPFAFIFGRQVLQGIIAHEAAHSLITLSSYATDLHNDPEYGPVVRSDTIYRWGDACTY